MTAQFWLWVVLSGLGGGVVGWWIRGWQTSGRELTVKREFDNRLTAFEDDARRSLERARSDSEAHWRHLALERDVLYARLSEIDPRGRWRADLATPPPAARRPGAARRSAATSQANEEPNGHPGPTPGMTGARRPSRRPRKASRPTTNGAATAVGADPDDLKRIKGIGPTFEQRLNEMGYTTFRDLAAWSVDDLDQLGERLGARIRLEEWSARAEELHREKYGSA